MKHGHEGIPRSLWTTVEMLKRRSDRLGEHEIPDYVDAAANSLLDRAYEIGVFWTDTVFCERRRTPREDITHTHIFADGNNVDVEERAPFTRMVTMSYAPEAIAPILGQIVVARRNESVGCSFTVQLTVDGVIQKPQVNLGVPSVIVMYQRPKPTLHTLRWEWMSGMNTTVFSCELPDGKRLGLGLSSQQRRATLRLKRTWPPFIETYYMQAMRSLNSAQSGYGLMQQLVQVTTPLEDVQTFQSYTDEVLREGLGNPLIRP